MCGLLGFATDGKHPLSPDMVVYILTQLMRENEWRGGDSFGIAVMRPERVDEPKVKTYKQVGKITDKVRDTPWMSAMSDIYGAIQNNERVVVIGHNRKATTGANTSRNAHPFEFGKLDRENGQFVLGAHNGVIPWHDKYAEAWKITRDIEVDSEVIFRGMQVLDEEKVLGQLEAHGGMALTYMRDDHTVKFYRGSNPLSLAVGSHFAFWSSEKKHLYNETFGLQVGVIELSANTFRKLDSRNMSIQPLAQPKVLDAPFPDPYQKASKLIPRTTGGYNPHTHTPRTDPFVAPAEGKAAASSGAELAAHRRPHITMMPDDELVKGCCDTCNRSMKLWELLYYKDDTFCSYCYWVMVQMDAEEDMQLEASRGRSLPSDSAWPGGGD